MLTQAANFAVTNPPAIASPMVSFGTVTKAIEYEAVAMLDAVTEADDAKALNNLKLIKGAGYHFMQVSDLQVPPAHEMVAISMMIFTLIPAYSYFIPFQKNVC